MPRTWMSTSFASTPSGKFGDEGIRTPDIRVANAALYQLSYVPEALVRCFRGAAGDFLTGAFDEQRAFEDQGFHEEEAGGIRYGEGKIAEAHRACLQALKRRSADVRQPERLARQYHIDRRPAFAHEHRHRAVEAQR